MQLAKALSSTQNIQTEHVMFLVVWMKYAVGVYVQNQLKDLRVFLFAIMYLNILVSISHQQATAKLLGTKSAIIMKEERLG